MQVHLIADCSVCRKPVDQATECWRGAVTSPGLVHVLCFAALVLIEEFPSRLNHEIADEVNERGAEFCDMLCENPEHINSPIERN